MNAPSIIQSKKVITYLLFALIFSCGSSDGSSDDTPAPTPALTSLQITSSNGNQLDLSGTNSTTLNVTGKDQFGATIPIAGSISWSSNNSNATVTNSGVVTGKNTGNSTITASSGGVSSTYAITIINSSSQSGTFVYVSDAASFNTGPWQILRYDENGQNGTVFIDENLAWPQDILFMETDEEVLISNLNSGEITKYNASTGAPTGNFASGIGGPTRMKIGADNLLYVLQWAGNGFVLRYQLDGTFVDEFTDVAISRSIGLAWDSSGNLYVSSFGDKTVRKFDPEGNDLGLFISAGLAGPTDIWFDEKNNLFVNDWSGNKVVQFNAAGEYVTDFVASGLNQPEGVDFFPNGDILIGSGGTSEIKMYGANGVFIKDFVTAGAAGLKQPNAVRIRQID
ncbi:Ig-like domain-containing protein [Muricauda sp. 2012CJ35-5]|uniref:Ig-like domain-containing protein n=1 Tax=Flagellimonas spongiicola TaxID=2942208 RepID=A0ABT0PNY9_9FLAO|nr:Ig-like domain-containing protein [Allomuricauda spongiicola]MCL6273113.1 Ig-like domain-containing protein [Allomuricauda spongiicola]